MTTNTCPDPDTSLSAWLKKQTQPTWNDTVTHQFTTDLGTATLETTVFTHYLLQDYAFINALVSAFGFAVGQAPTITAKRHLIDFLDTLTDEENTYFERTFAALEIPAKTYENPPLHDVTNSLIDLLGRATRQGGYVETLAVLVPAEWIYHEWATRITTPPDEPFYYREWIELHDNDEFNNFVTWLRSELDTAGTPIHPQAKQTVSELFARTVELEAAFFDAAYDQAGGELD
jgi:thiaminase/transcriptional activator TenA